MGLVPVPGPWLSVSMKGLVHEPDDWFSITGLILAPDPSPGLV